MLIQLLVAFWFWSNRIFATIEYVDKNYIIHSYSVTSVVTDHGLNDFYMKVTAAVTLTSDFVPNPSTGISYKISELVS